MSYEAEKTRLRRRLAGGGAIFAVFAIVIWFAVFRTLWTTRPTLERAREAFEQGDYESANQIMAKVVRRDDSTEASLLGARLALLREDRDEAERLLMRIVADQSSGIAGLLECGKMWKKFGRLSEAENYFRLVIKRKPRHVEAHEQLLELMRLEGRGWEARQLADNLFPQKRFLADHLRFVGSLTTCPLNNTDSQFMSFCEGIDLECPLPQLARVRQLLANNQDVERVQQRLRDFIAKRPDLVEPQAMLGNLLFEAGDDDIFLRWHADLPKGVDPHPDIWVLRGRWAHRKQDNERAIACFWEAIQRNPIDRTAHFFLAKMLISVGRVDDAVPFQERGDLLLEFDNELSSGGGNSEESVVHLIETLEKLGRHWEAFGWCQVLKEMDEHSPLADQLFDRINAKVDPLSRLTPNDANPALAIDLSEYSIPNLPPLKTKMGIDIDSVVGEISFANSAEDVGMSAPASVDGKQTSKNSPVGDFAGRGVGVIDFDNNGWPDVYLTRSQDSLAGGEPNERKNSLFQNQGDRFVDVADLAKIDQPIGQGTAVGDFNSDGFPDLYITNLGANALYLNNGDGTFENITALSDTGGDTGGDAFSLSAAFADFSGDGLPDLYVVNYGGDPGAKRSVRGTSSGQFDRLYLNLGDGHFREISEQAGITSLEGPAKGTALLVANLDGQPGLDIVVANDSMPNRLYLNQNSGPETVRFVERGNTAGVAYNEKGTLQGSVGLAAADINTDKLLDIFVTNSANERNNCLTQISEAHPPLFTDLGTETNLSLSSLPETGWGAQFLDADLDGDWDLFVANGHSQGSDNSIETSNKAQLPHLFENLAPPRFRFISTSEHPKFQLVPNIGDYSNTYNSGRAVASLDWNRDGLPDLCVTHRQAPVALLTNTSDRRGQFIAIELRGVQSSRDAIGTILEIDADRRTWTVPLTAGNGFCASNQRQILIGVGRQARYADKVTIHWPQGEPQVIKRLPLDARWLIVQGDPTAHQLPD